MPTISKFLANLDRDKEERDRKLDEQKKQPVNQQSGDVTPHTAEPAGKAGTRKTVTDPTTQHQVVIEDVNKDFMEKAKNPQV